MKLNMHSDFIKLLGGSGMIFVCRLLGAAAVLVTQIVLARWIGEEELGHYVYAFSWSVMLGTIATLGFPASAFNTIGNGIALRQDNYIRGFIRRGTQIIITTSLLTSAVGLAVVHYMGQVETNSHTGVFLVAMIIVPVFAMLRWQSSIAYGFSWFGLAIIPENLIRPLILLLAILLVWSATDGLVAQDVMLLNLVATLGVTVTLYFVVMKTKRKVLEPVKPSYETTAWLNKAIPFLFIILFTNYFMEMNIIIAGKYLAADQLAIFNAGFRIAFLVSFGIQAVDAYILPRAAELHAKNDTASQQQLISRASKLKLAGALVAIIGLAVFGKNILGLFGPGFVSGYVALMVIAFAQLVIAALGPLTYLLAIYGHQYDCLYVFFASLMVMLGMHGYFTDQYGINGAAITVAVVMVFQAIWLYILVVRKLQLFPSAFSGGRISR